MSVPTLSIGVKRAATYQTKFSLCLPKVGLLRFIVHVSKLTCDFGAEQNRVGFADSPGRSCVPFPRPTSFLALLYPTLLALLFSHISIQSHRDAEIVIAHPTTWLALIGGLITVISKTAASRPLTLLATN